MNAYYAMGSSALTIAALAAIADERMRAYGLHGGIRNVRAFAVAAAATLTRGCLALGGAGGFDTSIAVGIAAVSAATDLQFGYVFDRVLLTGGIALFAVEAVQGRLGAALGGGAAAASALAILWALSRGRGMGLGDLKLAGVLGLALGPYAAMQALWFAFVIGAFVTVAAVVLRGRERSRTVPFAPFLAVGAVLSMGRSAW